MECYPYYYTVTRVSHTQLGQLRFQFQLKPSLPRNALLMRKYFPYILALNIIDSILVYLRVVISAEAAHVGGGAPFRRKTPKHLKQIFKRQEP